MAAHPGAVVVTVTAGKPPPHRLTDWDRQCGFSEMDDVVQARRAEDAAAVEQLGARPRWLDFLDRQYVGGQPPSRVGIRSAIEAVITGRRDGAPGMIASPLGLSHPDHVVTAAACFDLARAMPTMTWVVYEDAIYRATDGTTSEAVVRLAEAGFALEPLDVKASTRKRAAIDRYPSQLKGLGGLIGDAYKPERYWSVVSRP